jgi:hypothetical protein
VSVVKSGNKIVDVVKDNFGIKRYALMVMKDFPERKAYKDHGVNNHQDHAGVGSALPDCCSITG